MIGSGMPTSSARLEHVAINTNDHAASLAFYRDVLGFPVLEEVYVAALGVRRTYLDAGPARIELLAYDAPRRPGTDRREETGLRHLALVVDDVEAIAAQLLGQGVVFTQLPTPGVGSVVRKAILLDPHGVEIELVEHAGSQRSPSGLG